MADSNNASMIHGHAAYVAGAAQEQVGNLSGSEAWRQSGQEAKEAAVNEMRSAKEASGGLQDRGDTTMGKVEKSVGSAVGCEGMVEEGGSSTGGVKTE
ncbi:hypothetical protein MMC25_002428 [Agyrium rufum]|nr:hypothetical protein [Agyrium rufum]